MALIDSFKVLYLFQVFSSLRSLISCLVVDLFISMIVDRWLILKSNFFCFCMKDADLSVFHFQCRVLDIKEGPGFSLS